MKTQKPTNKPENQGGYKGVLKGLADWAISPPEVFKVVKGGLWFRDTLVSGEDGAVFLSIESQMDQAVFSMINQQTESWFRHKERAGILERVLFEVERALAAKDRSPWMFPRGQNGLILHGHAKITRLVSKDLDLSWAGTDADAALSVAVKELTAAQAFVEEDLKTAAVARRRLADTFGLPRTKRLSAEGAEAFFAGGFVVDVPLEAGSCVGLTKYRSSFSPLFLPGEGRGSLLRRTAEHVMGQATALYADLLALADQLDNEKENIDGQDKGDQPEG